MNARGTRRPHPRRVYRRSRKPSRTAGRSKSCLVLVLAFLALPALIWTVAR